MSLSSEMKNLSEDILASFKQRIKENEELVNDVQKTLDGFRKDHQEMAAVLNANAKNLRKDLNQGEKDRMKIYGELLTGIHGTISTIQEEVVAIQVSAGSLINEFTTGRSQMAEELNKFFAEGRTGRMQDENARMKEFDSLMKNIHSGIKNLNDKVVAIFKDTNDMLDKFENEHLTMSGDLKADLKKNLTERIEYTRTLLNGFQKRLSEISIENQKAAQKLREDLAGDETERLREYTVIMKGIHASIDGISKEVTDIQKATSAMIGGFATDRKMASEEWDKMQNTITKLKRGEAAIVSKEVISKPEKKIVEKAELVKEVAKEIPDEIQPKAEPQPEFHMTLEEKVLDYINKHPSGLKISEMEQPLGESRMKLGFVAKALLEDGKVQKMENTYFPLK